MSNDQYFAAKPAKEMAEIMMDRANSWFHHLITNGYLYKLRDSWSAYTGAYYTDANSGHQLTFGGEQGELVQLAVNHVRNIGRHMLTMITANRPALNAVSNNTDSKSLIQAKLANSLLEYYLKEKKLEDVFIKACEYAIVLASGYVKIEWNDTTGEIYDYNPDTGAPVYEGDINFEAVHPYNVFVDPNKEDNNHNWVMVRKFVNKYDLAAKYPEFADKIKSSPVKSEVEDFKFDTIRMHESDEIAVFEIYHKPTESVPDGRYMMMVTPEIILTDMEMPFRELPIYKISPADILGTPYGYTPLFDLLPIQDAVNSLYSTILTNQAAFGVQNLYVDRRANINWKSLDGGLNLVEGDGAEGKPQPLNLTQTPKEIFDFLQMLEQSMETVSGINSVTRGNPEASLKSGTSLAMVHSTALQYMSGLQASYVRLMERVGMGLLYMLRDFAKVPRIAMIAGINNAGYVERQFTGDDLLQINRVTVKVGNPLSKTTAGRSQIASELIQYGIIKTPEQYFTVLNTGNLEVMSEGQQDELFLIRDENERMIEGLPIKTTAIDQHMQHIKEHRSVMNKSEIRMDDETSARVYEHIMEHIEHLRTIDPAVLALIGEQPLGPAAGSPPAQPDPQGGTNESMQPSLGAASQPQAPAAEVPNTPRPPAPFEEMPTTAQEMGEMNQG